jgi:hypothetical protein
MIHTEISEGLVYLKLHRYHQFFLTLALAAASGLSAQAQTAVPPVQTPAATGVAAAQSATTGTLRGHITDPTGALIPGAAVTVTTSAGGAVKSATADASGAYSVGNLPPGGYIVDATYAGFADFSSPTIQLAAGQSKRVDIAMAIETAQQSVVVTDDTPQVNIDASGNTSAIVLKGKDLDALSDDPDELSNELTALAGPSAGPNGGQIYIDGFTGGQLPPKSAIREIRINQNPFSAEFDKLGYGRIEILTKPGTDKLHGRAFIQGNDDVFNTGNPFTGVLPAYHSIQFNGTVSGALGKKASFFLSAEQRNNQNDSVYRVDTAVLQPGSNTWVEDPNLSGAVFNPSTRTNISPRIDLQLGQKNTLTVRYQFSRHNESGDIGSTSLPSQSNSELTTEHTIQVSDSEIINDHVVNETRFQYLRDSTTDTPVSSAPTVTVPGYFTGGGSSDQTANDHGDHLELQNLTTMSVGAQAIKFGTRVRENRDANSTSANFNGTFNFATVADYVSALNGTGALPSKLSYTTGTAGAVANVFDAALFFQDDWKANRNLTLSGGVRWETQNHISDHDDWGPRFSFAYALDGHKDKKQAKTVVRGGYGFFYDRLTLGDMLQAERFNNGPGSQTQTTVNDPTCFNATTLDTSAGNCAAGTTTTSTIVRIAPRFHAPTTEQFGASLERQLTKTTTVTATYLHTLGVHQMVSIDANAYAPIAGTTFYNSTTGARPNPNLGIVNEYYPEAVFKQNQVIVNANARISPKLSFFGFYNFTIADSDGAGGSGAVASNSYNLKQDYGRASFASRNMVFFMGNYTGPWGISFNPFLIAQSGRPFNVVTANDLTGDNFFNNRPAFAASSECADQTQTQYVQTSLGCFNTMPGQNDTLVPANMGNGPAGVALNLRVSRSFGIGPKLAAGENGAGGPPGGGGGPPGGGRGGPGGGPGGGLGPGGLGGGGRGPGGPFGGVSTNRKYSLNFSAQALNLFNDIDYGPPRGTVAATPLPLANQTVPGTTLYGPDTSFGKSTSLAGGIFSSGSAARRIFFQAVFQF